MYNPRYCYFPYHNDDKFTPVAEKTDYNYYNNYYYQNGFTYNTTKPKKEKKINNCIIQ